MQSIAGRAAFPVRLAIQNTGPQVFRSMTLAPNDLRAHSTPVLHGALAYLD
jgi:hypothetical protein